MKTHGSHQARFTRPRARMKMAAMVAAACATLSPPVLAQSTVTISGRFTMAVDSVKIKNRAGNTNETGVNDNTSYIRFNVVEDLGGGVLAIGQLETRNELDLGTLAATGPTFVGLKSKAWGQIIFGRENLHYGLRSSDMFAAGAELRIDSLGILAYANGGATAIAAATRTPNVVQYTSPSWNGFAIKAAYSSQPGNAANGEADIGSSVRKGKAWNLNPSFRRGDFEGGYSYWDSKADGAFAGLGAPAKGAAFGQAAGTDQRGDRLYGSYVWGGFKAGLVWDKARVRTVTAAARTEISDRTAWSVPLRYQAGKHGFYAEYSKANKDKAAAFSGLDTKADLFSLAYIYSLSKRTSVSLNYARMDNGANSFYNLYTQRSGTQDPVGLASTGAGVNRGEDPRVLGAAISHYF